MPLQESSATALVRFTGLGIICFNRDAHRGEIAVIRDNKHSLSVKLQRPVFQEGGESDVIVYQDIATYDNLPKEDLQIEVKATREAAIDGYEIYQSGEFDRLNSPDVNDFRWVVNMNSLHDNASLSPNGQAAYPVTKLYISNGLFYTHKLDTALFFEKVSLDAGGTATAREAFGNVAETIGVKLEGEEVSFTIRVGEQEETHTLERVEGLPFRIEIKNMDYNEDAVYSDMADYYKYLSSADGNRFDLAPVIEGAEGDNFNQKQFCHPVASDLPSIDQL
ncbi:MAG: hypothetical protein JOZ52_13665 [Acidobacteria bacterium]|nr:hypothetical protein [Acidobacteriota bacterium]